VSAASSFQNGSNSWPAPRASSLASRGSAGQLNKTQPVHPKQPRLLNALGFSLPAGQQRARDPRPERPQRALQPARSTLCSNAVQARHAPATRQSPRIPALKKQRPRRLLSEVAVYQSRPRSSRAAAFGSKTVCLIGFVYHVEPIEFNDIMLLTNGSASGSPASQTKRFQPVPLVTRTFLTCEGWR
jgi:hypothetical protein